jgi:hypothetical protein
MPRKMIHFHSEALTALEQLAADRMATVQELADEAFDDLLRKHRRPVGLKASLKASAKDGTEKQPPGAKPSGNARRSISGRRHSSR